MNLLSRFKPNTHSITYQALADEMVIVYLETGIYYSLESVGTLIWNELTAGSSMKKVMEELCLRFDELPEEIEKSLKGFITQLQEEKLITPQKEVELTFSFFHPPSKHFCYAKAPYIHPYLNKYTEMQELLLLDPSENEGMESSWAASCYSNRLVTAY